MQENIESLVVPSYEFFLLTLNLRLSQSLLLVRFCQSLFPLNFAFFYIDLRRFVLLLVLFDILILNEVAQLACCDVEELRQNVVS